MSVKNLPEPTVYLTQYDIKTHKSSVLAPEILRWGHEDEGKMPMATAFVAHFPIDLNNDADLVYSNKIVNQGCGLVSKGSALLRYVDLAPGHTTMMHLTQSLDYGVVVGGEAECVMDNGQVQRMKIGDVMVQRYTKHAWRNPSETQWARIIFSLMDAEPLIVDGKPVKEDLGRGAAYLQSSGN